MIFLTVGSQMPFDRLAQAVDDWAADHPQHLVFGQLGQGEYRPRHYAACVALTPAEFKARVAGCSLLVGHAGMGTVLTGLEFGKPLLLLPRLGRLQETRNDHQLATLRWLSGKPGIHAAFDEAQLREGLSAFSRGEWREVTGATVVPPARQALTDRLRRFIEQE